MSGRESYTGWFPPSIKPVHVGVYEVKPYPEMLLRAAFAHWNGSYWSATAVLTPREDTQSTIDRANELRNIEGDWAKDCHWRGLSEKPVEKETS